MKCDSLHMGISEITGTLAKTYNFTDKSKAYKPWVAKISGIDPKFGFKREFLKTTYGARMYAGQIQMNLFHLEKGFVYQYKDFLLLFIKPEVREGFFAIDAHGQVTELTKDEIRTYLNMR